MRTALACLIAGVLGCVLSGSIYFLAPFAIPWFIGAYVVGAAFAFSVGAGAGRLVHRSLPPVFFALAGTAIGVYLVQHYW